MSGRGFDRGIGRVLGVLLVAGGFVRLPAQEEELRGRLLLAARGATTATDLQSLCDATAIDELLTVVAEHQAELFYRGAWSKVEQALSARQPDIERAWGERPERRSAWARGLAHCRWFWSAAVPRHGNADAWARADLEQVAQHAPLVLLERWLRTRDDLLRASGHALYRAAVAGQAAHADDCTAVARARPAYLVQAHVLNGCPRLSPFVLRDALVDGDAHVRARACWALRRLMKYEPRELANLPVPNLAAVLVRLRADRPVDPDNPSAVVVAVELRLRPVARLRALPRPQPAAIAMAGIDVEPRLIRELFPERLADQLHLFLSGSSKTRCGALVLAAQEETWSTSLEHEVVRQLRHESADVRLAAYLALATRDPGVSLCSLFENEAVFDPDPRIRALAR